MQRRNNVNKFLVGSLLAAGGAFLTYKLFKSENSKDFSIGVKKAGKSLKKNLKNGIKKLRKSSDTQTYIIKDGLGNSFEYVTDASEENTPRIKDFIENTTEDEENFLKKTLNKAKSEFYDKKSES